MQDDHARSLTLLILTVGRWFLNTGTRMVYPFLPAFARGLEITLQEASRLVAVRSFAGILSPLFGALSEQYGRRPILILCLLALNASSILILLWPGYAAFGLALALWAIIKVIFDPALQAYIGDAVPYAVRGRVISLTELSWSAALLLGAPLVGWLIGRYGWQAPFVVLGAGGLVTGLLLWRIMPPAPRRTGATPRLRHLVPMLRRHPVILAACLYALLLMLANDIIFIVYGDWMEASFGLNLGALGLAAGVIGGAEIAGELSAGWAVDRFGKRPVVIRTGLLGGLSYALLPFISSSLPAALMMLAITFYCFEVTIVGAIPLLTELAPQARGVVLSAVVAASALGRALGAWLGPEIWAWGGIRANGLISAVLAVLAILVLIRWVHEAGAPHQEEGGEEYAPTH